jgi:hypothetical protein
MSNKKSTELIELGGFLRGKRLMRRKELSLLFLN